MDNEDILTYTCVFKAMRYYSIEISFVDSSSRPPNKYMSRALGLQESIRKKKIATIGSLGYQLSSGYLACIRQTPHASIMQALY